MVTGGWRTLSIAVRLVVRALKPENASFSAGFSSDVMPSPASWLSTARGSFAASGISRSAAAAWRGREAEIHMRRRERGGQLRACRVDGVGGGPLLGDVGLERERLERGIVGPAAVAVL